MSVTTLGNNVSAVESETLFYQACNEGYTYSHLDDYAYKEVEFQHEHTNNSPTTDSVTYSVSVTESADASTTVSVSLDGMVASAGVDTQVGWGVTTSETLSITWSVPAYSTYRLRAGSEWVKASGTETYTDSRCYTSSKSVDGNWTFQSWSDKQEL
ncbi:hypothetical protein [Salirhabdus salicampi]|uniref:hypothetical protein n=1 Tax=Salirhabdus salicampi TaxID=476102 RepID=UPI0020C3A829|nr:hypothetical protein [Salirhabdus salicampi]MCP8616356.1 hypothetical protein [Salirhabdus salicampi]